MLASMPLGGEEEEEVDEASYETDVAETLQEEKGELEEVTGGLGLGLELKPRRCTRW